MQGPGVRLRAAPGGTSRAGVDPSWPAGDGYGSGAQAYTGGWPEQLFSWLHGFRKLRFVTEKTKEMQLAFLNLALSLICLRYL
ncbi:MAG: hypothetical protein U0797_27345 [Gemmataceae bacterium]